ncbi:unnamed protein product [Protopolystoma xenopodis]|uniref:Uncharacterized protein n=1 Tax=Protopolystoma xenopodis TaxID=117903 RepID=A0A3S5B9F6_9PLAT|nr:unnamed protein product [Protopolystoma xenopodis]
MRIFGRLDPGPLVEKTPEYRFNMTQCRSHVPTLSPQVLLLMLANTLNRPGNSLLCVTTATAVRVPGTQTNGPVETSVKRRLRPSTIHSRPRGALGLKRREVTGQKACRATGSGSVASRLRHKNPEQKGRRVGDREVYIPKRSVCVCVWNLLGQSDMK